MTSATVFIDEPDTIRNEAVDNGTLTAEQVMAIAGKHQPDYCSDTHVCFDWRAIADELNAILGSKTCEPKWTLQGTTQTQEFWRCDCGNCGECFGVEDRQSFPFKMTIDKVDIPNYCPNCGRKVVKQNDQMVS